MFCSVKLPNRTPPSALRVKSTSGRLFSSRPTRAFRKSRPVITAARATRYHSLSPGTAPSVLIADSSNSVPDGKMPEFCDNAASREG